MPDIFNPIATIVAALIAVGAGLIAWLVRRWWLARLRGEVSAFEFITDSATLLPKLYGHENDDNPLADHNIPYQPRDAKRDIQAELRQKLSENRYLLITGRSGLGKTREAGILVQSLMNEGYRVVRIVKSGWLDKPKQFPPELKDVSRRILFLLDDLNSLFSAGDTTQSPKAEQMPLLGSGTYHDRLLEVLKYFEEICGATEVRVIATARDETDYWAKLKYQSNDTLWKRFARFELPEPTVEATEQCLTDAANSAGLSTKADDLPTIARQNDGTYMNVVVNLQRLQTENKPVTAATYTPTLAGSWRQVYERAVKRHAAVQYIYDAIDILKQADIELYIWLIEPTARHLWGDNIFQGLFRRIRIRQAMHYLSQETKVLAIRKQHLTTRDGQIEAKGNSVDWRIYTSWLIGLLLDQSRSHSKEIVGSLGGFALMLHGLKQYEQAATLFKKIVVLLPNAAPIWGILGWTFFELQQYNDAERAFYSAITLEPNEASRYSSLGLLYVKQNRFAEAVEAYLNAIKINPNDEFIYFSLGLIYLIIQQSTKAENAFRNAIALDPNYADAYYHLGVLFAGLKRYSEAEEAYRTTITLNPGYAQAYNNLGRLLRLYVTYREHDAILIYLQLVELESRNFDAHIALACLYKQAGNNEASAMHITTSRNFVRPEDWYNLACLESISDNVDAAFDNLQKARLTDKFDVAWAWRDPDLQWIRDDPRFREIVGENPNKG